ncbi:MAG: beta-propeller domain-containing protein [Myxococcales bacterium]
MSLRTRLGVSALWLCCVLGLAACGDENGDKARGGPPDDPDGPPTEPGDHETDFISDVPSQSTGAGALAPEANGDASSGDGDSASESGGEADRAIAEADIIQVDGDRLYALSRYTGMHVIDVSNPAQLQVLGRWRVKAEPFEMYLKGNVAYVMFNAFGRYEVDSATGQYVWRESSRMQALDVSNPGKISLIGSYDLGGNISDSRMVGNVIYTVTYEYGYCWACDPVPNTRVASFDVKDPTKFTLVDQLRFSDGNGYSWGPRSVSVSQTHMFVAGPHWDDKDGTIQVVDIADPAGDLKLGAEVTIHGSIDSRWQMDEYEGVLRVVSQPRSWQSSDSPHLSTFRIDDADHLVKLAELGMVLPRLETLQSARFDGDRAFVVTFERTDPLFTFDVSDPAAPKQVGALEIPGFLYHMEPRGDLLYALGFDQGNEAGAMHVSIFDVSNLAAPQMKSRVNFGGDWAYLAEDQDRVHKLFNLALDQNLIMVPFGGGSYDELSCNYEYLSGIQLIDAMGSQLTLRGMAPQLGQARRALLHRDHLFGVTDNAVQVFDISDRSTPRRIEQLEVARNIEYVKVVGENVMRFGRDWWTDRAVLDIAAPDAVEAAEGLGELDLSGGGTNDNDGTCQQYGWSGWDGRVFVHGDYAYIPRSRYKYESNGTNEQTIRFYVVALKDPTALKVVGTFDVAPATNNEWLGEVLLTDSALLVGRGAGYYSYWDQGTDKVRYSYDIFTLENPSAPAFVKRFDVPSTMAGGGWGYGMGACGVDMYWGYWYGGTSALVSGNLVVSQHESDVDDGTQRVRYYLDRLDVSDPRNPVLLPPVNIPGQVVHYDGASQRAVTVSYVHHEERAANWQDCTWRAYGAWYEDESDACHLYERQVNVLAVDDDKATRISQLKLDGERIATSLGVSNERFFYLSSERKPYDYNNPTAASQRLETLAFAAGGQIQRLPSLELEDSLGYYWYGSDLKVRGTRAFVPGNGTLQVAQTSDKLHPALSSHEVQAWGCSYLEIGTDRAYCASNEYGVTGIPLQQ